MPAHRKDTADAFDQFWIPEPNSGCSLWLGGVDRRGYGMFWFDGKTGRATHYALRRAGRPVPPGKMALHSCDNTFCVNDDHLFIGTAADNHADSRKKRRHSHGEGHGQSELSERDILAIRASPESDRKLAARIGMNRSTISKIRLRKLWPHVACQI